MLTRVLFALVLTCGGTGITLAQETTLVGLGVADHKVSEDELQGGAALATPKFNTAGIAYAYVAHAMKDDVIEITLKKDGKSLMSNKQELDADEAGVLVQAGKTGVPAGGWPEGTYTAHVKVTRGGKELIAEESEPVPFE